MLILQCSSSEYRGIPHPTPVKAFAEEVDLMLAEKKAVTITSTICKGRGVVLYRTARGDFIVVSASKDGGCAYSFHSLEWAMKQFLACSSFHLTINEEDHRYDH